MLIENDVFAFGIEQEQARLAIGSLVGSVEDARRDGCLIAHADEARHIGLYHHVLLGHGLAIEQAVHHVLRMCQAHEAPCGKALGQCELHLHTAATVGLQLGEEEGRLLQVLPDLHLGTTAVLGGLFLSSTAIAHNNFFRQHIMLCGSIKHAHLFGFQNLAFCLFISDGTLQHCRSSQGPRLIHDVPAVEPAVYR